MNGTSIALPSRKGGSGKTAATTSLADEFGRRKKKVIVLDCDQQCSVSERLLKGQLKPDDPTLYDVMVNGANIGDAIYEAGESYHNCYIMPGSPALKPDDPKFNNEISKETLIKRIVDPLRNNFDIILIDAPPALSVITVAVLAACDFYLIPLGFDRTSLEGITPIHKACEKIKKAAIGSPKYLGAFCTQYGQKRLRATKDFDHLAETIEGMLNELHIPGSSNWTQAEMRNTTLQSERTHPVSIGYQKLTKYITKEINNA